MRMQLTLCALIHQREELTGSIPVANSHILVNSESNNTRQLALTGFSNQAREIQDLRTNESLIYSGFGDDTFDRLSRRQRFLQEDHVVAIFLWLASKTFRCLAHDF